MRSELADACIRAGIPKVTPNELRHSAATILAENPGSARYDKDQSAEDRQGYFNLMLLCPGHHKLVDDLEPQNYSVERLTAMKESHLAAFAKSTWTPGDEQLAKFVRLAIQEWRVFDRARELLDEEARTTQTVVMPGAVELVAEVPSGTVNVAFEPDTIEARGEAFNPTVQTDDDTPS
jgi:hypothetical protein